MVSPIDLHYEVPCAFNTCANTSMIGPILFLISINLLWYHSVPIRLLLVHPLIYHDQVQLFCCYLVLIGEGSPISSTVIIDGPSDSSPSILPLPQRSESTRL